MNLVYFVPIAILSFGFANPIDGAGRSQTVPDPNSYIRSLAKVTVVRLRLRIDRSRYRQVPAEFSWRSGLRPSSYVLEAVDG